MHWARITMPGRMHDNATSPTAPDGHIMPSVEPTPQAAEQAYKAMEARLNDIRARLRRPLTLGEKLLLGHASHPQDQELVPGHSYLQLYPDRVVFQDVLGQTGLLQFMQSGRQQVAVPTTIHCDHLIRARHEARS